MKNSRLESILDELSNVAIKWSPIYDVYGVGFETKINEELSVQIGYSSSQSKTPSIQIKIKETLLIFPDIPENTETGKNIISFYNKILVKHHNNVLSENDFYSMIISSVKELTKETRVKPTPPECQKYREGEKPYIRRCLHCNIEISTSTIHDMFCDGVCKSLHVIYKHGIYSLFEKNQKVDITHIQHKFGVTEEELVKLISLLVKSKHITANIDNSFIIL